MARNKDDMVLGVVRTNKQGSEVEFEVCTHAEWEAMTEEEQDAALSEAAHESGMFEISIKEDIV